MTGAPVHMLNACTVVNRRPRNLPEYQAACNAVTTGEVVELDAATVRPGMVVWFFSRWRVVADVLLDGRTAEIHLAGGNGSARRYTSRDTPVYRQAPR